MSVPTETPTTDRILSVPDSAPTVLSPERDLAYCGEMLPKVSRTFALCIKLLPSDLERSVMVAYLLCRIADTIEDAEDLPAGDKRALLQRFADNVGAPRDDVGYLREAFSGDGSAEDHLCHNADRVLRAFGRLGRDEQEAVRPWVAEMCAGMVEFSREPVTPGSAMPSLERLEDLDRYCYYVAGTVGHLLTALFSLKLAQRDRDRVPQLEAYATSFGLGLQLTNIIKDAAKDHRLGWSFIPRELCDREGIDVDELFGSGHADASRRVFTVLIDKARGHLQDALHYTTLFPATQYRIRLFCLTSLYFAVRTLSLAAADDGRLVEGGTVKITRGEVYRILATTCVVAPS
ncbi:MAG: phytoene/squalene synthase family protein, partial [Gemmatimonadales bacterium]